MKNIAAVVVTYNRVELLKRCLAALHAQSVPVETIVVVDNNSNDETGAWLREWASQDAVSDYNRLVVSMKRNTGGAGGFYEGIKRTVESGHEWVWIMDDDVIAETDALSALIEAADVTMDRNSYYASYALDESKKHHVNVPSIDQRPAYMGYPDWGTHLSSGLVRITRATFVSLLFPADAVRDVGLPIPEFFIWGDDSEYTMRMSQNGYKGYLVSGSRVAHCRPGPQGMNIKVENDPNRIKNYRYYYRNALYRKRKQGASVAFRFSRKSFFDGVSCLLMQGSWVKFWVVVRGITSGLVFSPRVRYVSEGPENISEQR